MTNKIRIVQKRFLRAYEQTCGNVSSSCIYAGISRQTFYRWRRGNSSGDRWFKRRLELLKPLDRKLDLAEMKLMELIDAGNVRAIIYALKTHGRDRGWGFVSLTEKEKKLLKLDCLVKSVNFIETAPTARG